MIKLEGVNKIIKGKTVLEDINYVFENGVTYGLKGINGSGKTMLMKLICGLICPSSGKITVDGRVMDRNHSFPGNLGILIENPAFLDTYTGAGNLQLLASLQNRITQEDIRQTLKRVGLDPEDKRKYRKYSLGMKQRLGIAAAIMEKPDILILDEPLNALDREGVALFDRILYEEKQRKPLIILSCHEEQKLKEYADVILEMENGRIVQEVTG